MFQDLIQKIHSWYPASCCSDKDCMPIPCDKLLEQNDGSILYEGIRFAANQIHPSLDAMCHVCFDPTSLTPYCVFILQLT